MLLGNATETRQAVPHQAVPRQAVPRQAEVKAVYEAFFLSFCYWLVLSPLLLSLHLSLFVLLDFSRGVIPLCFLFFIHYLSFSFSLSAL